MTDVLFFTREVHARFFPRLLSPRFRGYHAVLNLREKGMVEESGGTVVGCFEEEYDALPEAEVPADFLQSSYYGDRFLGWLSLDERREALARAISFWRRVFAERPYSHCVHETISFEGEEVLSRVAAERGCTDLTSLPTFLDGYFYWKSSPYHSAFPAERLARAPVTRAHLERAQAYLDGVKAAGHKPFRVRGIRAELPARPGRLALVADLARHEARRVAGEARRRLRGRDRSRGRQERKRQALFYYRTRDPRRFHDRWVDRWYGSVYGPDDLYGDLSGYAGYRKIFFPLHYEPEATLLYFSPGYADQPAVIQEIARNLPHDCLLVVKEHPRQTGYLLRKEYVDLKRRLSNVVFLPGMVDSHALLGEVEAVLTITGSVGWEALVNNVPTIVLGNVFYDRHPGAVKPEAIREVRELLRPGGMPRPRDVDTLDLAARILACSHPGRISDRSALADPENVRQVTAALVQAVAAGEGRPEVTAGGGGRG